MQLYRKNKVSAVIITYNEAGNLKHTLPQLYWCDEIIIVDSHSTDDTVALCQAYGCKIFYRNFSGYGEQKHFAIGKASNDWVLCIDADEYLTPALIDELQEELTDTGDCRGYLVPMNLVFLGKEFSRGRESHRYFLRLFNKKWCEQGTQKVHERVEVRGPVKKLKNIIKHYSYNRVDNYLAKLGRYSTLGAEKNIAAGKKRPQALVFICVPIYFFRNYLINGNIWNGKEGFYWSVLAAFSNFIKYIKMQEISKRKSESEANKIRSVVHPTSEESVHMMLSEHA